MKLCIIIPAYNEEKRIGKTLERYSDFFEKVLAEKKISAFEILVVLNACKDKTLGEVEKFSKKNKKIRYLNFERGGKGFAISKGFKDALKKNNDLIGFVDADGATPPEAFYDLVKALNSSDGVIASRWLELSVVKARQSLLRRVMSRGFNFIVRVLFLMPYRDTQCGAKLFRRKAIESVVGKIGVAQWAFDIEILYKIRKNGFEVKEIPTVWNDQKGSKLNVKKVPLQMFLAVMRLRMVNSPVKRFIGLYDKLPERFKIHKLS